MSAKEKASFAKLYGDMLIAQSMWKNDTLRQKKMIDSILKGTEFGNSDEVKEWLKEMTVSDPEGVRQMLDSTQAYLEKVRNPTPVPSPSKTTQSDSQP